MKLQWMLIAGLSLSALSTAACLVDPGVSCTDQYVYGLTVNVVDDAGDALCGATVTLTEGDYEEVLEESTDCAYIGAGERAGTYSLTVEKEGYTSAGVSEVVIGEDECHVLPETVDVTLTEES